MAESKSVVEMLEAALRLLCEPTDINIGKASWFVIEAKLAAQAESESRGSLLATGAPAHSRCD